MPALDVHSVFYGKGRSLFLSLHIFMPAFDIEIRDCPAVGDNYAPVTPFPAQDGVDQIVARTAWLPLEGVICGHHLFHVRLGHKVLECRQIGLVQIPA